MSQTLISISNEELQRLKELEQKVAMDLENERTKQEKLKRSYAMTCISEWCLNTVTNDDQVIKYCNMMEEIAEKKYDQDPKRSNDKILEEAEKELKNNYVLQIVPVPKN